MKRLYLSGVAEYVWHSNVNVQRHSCEQGAEMMKLISASSCFELDVIWRAEP